MNHIHVAAAAIHDQNGHVLLSRRAPDSHQGGLWEFPGGKLEPGESVASALRRELQEELDIQVSEHHPLIRVRHDYADRRVLLDVHKVTAWQGQPRGVENQPLRAGSLHRDLIISPMNWPLSPLIPRNCRALPDPLT